MKIVVVFIIAFSFLGLGFFDVLKQKRKTYALDEIVQFVTFIKGELHYKKSDFETLAEAAQKQKYQCINFDGLKIYADECCDEIVKTEFLQFVNRIGTTDTDGQVALCEEYLCRFSEKLNAQKENEKSKIQVKAALSVLSALCVIILSL